MIKGSKEVSTRICVGHDIVIHSGQAILLVDHILGANSRCGFIWRMTEKFYYPGNSNEISTSGFCSSSFSLPNLGAAFRQKGGGIWPAATGFKVDTFNHKDKA